METCTNCPHPRGGHRLGEETGCRFNGCPCAEFGARAETEARVATIQIPDGYRLEAKLVPEKPGLRARLARAFGS